MFFGNKNKIKKRIVTNVDARSISLAKKNRSGANQGSIFGKILSFLLIFVFAGVTGYLLFFSPFLGVTKISVDGAEKLDPASVREAIENSIAGKYLNFLPKNNIIFLSKNSLKSMLLLQFKRLEDVKIEKKFPETLNIFLKERQLAIVLCSAEDCFVIDRNGRAFTRADFQSDELGEKEMIVLNDDSNKSIDSAGNAVDSALAQYLLDIKNKLKSDIGLEIDDNFHTPQIISGDIRVITSGGWMVYFNADIPIQKEIETLRLVLEEKIGKEKTADLEYVDLRTENKVYYKLKNSDQSQQQNSDSAADQSQDKKEESNKSKKT